MNENKESLPIKTNLS